MMLELTINERPAALECEPDEMILGVLRREGLSSVRATCGIGVCGACTILLDGEPVSGCLLLAGQAAGRELTTVGMVLTAKRLLEENPDPSDEEIAAGLGGNLCRCGCYVKIRAAVRRAAA